HLLWTHGPDGRPLARLPAELARALDLHLERLGRRSDYRSGPAWQLFRIALADAPYRVIWPDLARRLAAVVPASGLVPLNTVYGIATRAADDAYALAALFNSRWLTALARLSADPARGGFRRFNARVVRELPLPPANAAAWPAWLAQHQVPAATRLVGILARHGGALLADAVGLGKSYVALAVALALGEPFALVVPAVLVDQWRTLLEEHGVKAPIVTHESLSATPYRPLPPSTVPYRLFIVDEAHRFRNPITNRYRALARLVVGSRVLLVTATPVHNRIADLFHLFRLFLRDHDLTALGVPSLWRAARGDADRHAVPAAAATQGRALGRPDFKRLFPAGSEDLQLAFFPLVLPPGPGAATERDRDRVRQLRALATPRRDPKADALARVLDGRVGKTIVFVQARASVHHLVRRLRRHRVAAVTGERG